jgi:hypothetical protein
MFQQVTTAFFCLSYASNDLKKVHSTMVVETLLARDTQPGPGILYQALCTTYYLLLEIGQSVRCGQVCSLQADAGRCALA